MGRQCYLSVSFYYSLSFEKNPTLCDGNGAGLGGNWPPESNQLHLCLVEEWATELRYSWRLPGSLGPPQGELLIWKEGERELQGLAMD